MSDVLITGAGVVSSLGQDTGTFWSGLLGGEVAIDVAPWVDDEHFAWWSGVRDFEPDRWVAPRVASGSDRFALFALAAADQALGQADLPELNPRRTGIAIGTSMGGTNALLKAQHQLEVDGPDAVDPKTMIKIWPNMAAGQIGMRYGLHGPSLTFCTACAASLDAIGAAGDWIRAGRADVVIAGGTEGGFGVADGSFVPSVFYSQAGYGVSGTGRERLRASMPFDVDRNGIVVGEGAAVVVVESRAHASRRGAPILGTIEGYASLADSYHPSSPEPSGEWEAEAMRLALDDAGLAASSVDAIVAHGTSTPKGDSAEIRAINQIYCDGAVKVTSIKGNLGHPSGAAGAQGVVAALCALGEGRLPHTAGTSEVDPEARFEVVTGTAAPIRSGHVQVNSFGFGGQNASLVLGRD